MRKIFLIALFALCAIEGFSQRYTPFQGWGFSARRLKADSVSIVPSDTVINKAPNSVAIFNGKVYFQNGTRWQDISYDLPINVRDSISALYPLLYNSSTGVLSADTGRNAINLATAGLVDKVKDSLAASIVLRLLISDTSSMLSSYRTTLNTVQVNKLNISDSSLYSTRGRLYKVTDSLGAIISSVTPDSSVYSTKAWRQKGIDSVQANLTAGLSLKLNLSDSSLYASRGRLYKVADSLGSVIASVSADSLVFSTKAYRQKGVDSVQANLTAGLALKLNISDTSSMLSPYYRTALANATIVQRITDSLRLLVRLRASGSGGIQLQNSVGTNVADFGIANTTNGSIAGGWNVGGNLAVTGTSGFTGKATFTDSIVGVNQRLSGSLISLNELRSNGGNGVYATSSTAGYWFDTSRTIGLVNYPLQQGLGFRTNNIDNRLFVSSNGYISLGHNSPAELLDAQSARAAIRVTSTTGTNTTYFQANNTGGSLNIGIDNSSGSSLFAEGAYAAGVWHTGPYKLTFGTNNTKRFEIASTGAATFSSSVTAQGALTATAQGNNITVGVDSSVTSTSYTLVLGDAGYLKRCSNASAITITVPTNASVAFPIGTTIYFSQQGAGKVSVSPATSDVTIQSEGSLLGTAGQHAVIGLIKVNQNRWLLVGNRG